MQYRHSILTLALLGMALCVGAVQAQDRQTISGTVTSADDAAPLPGANVSVPGTTAGTATNAQGQYSLQVPTDADSLRFSFVGFRAQTVPIAGRTTIDVALAPAAQQIDELVVIGYGEQQERDVTGTVTKVNEAELNRSESVSPDRLISGKVAGVQISSSDGAPGSQSFIRIRGATSVNADNQPLFVIDGVPVSNETNQAGRNPLNFLNPNDIANVTVLKDASAAAIYGARGANGVILIETKSGGGEDGRVSYNGSLSAGTVADRTDILGAQQFRQVVRQEAPTQMGLLGSAQTDWQDQAFRTAVGQEHNISFGRSYDDSNLRLSLGYLDQEGAIETSSTRRINGSVKYNQQFFDDQLSVTANLKGTQTRNSFEPGVVGNAISFAPTQPVRDVRSPYGGFFEWSSTIAEKNPVGQYILSENNGEEFRSLGNVETEYQVPYVDGLSARLNLGYDVTTGERELFQPTNLKQQADADDPGLVQRYTFSRVTSLVDAYLSYDRRFEEISSQIEFTGGYSYQETNEEYPEFDITGLTTNIFEQNNAAAGTTQTANITEIPSRLISGFGRLNYTFMDRYLLTLTVRRDGSSKFGPANRWGTFPSAALAWRVHQESFMEEVPYLSSLKLRGSWGVTGNQEIGDFLYEPIYVQGAGILRAQFGNEFVSTVRPGAADRTVKWEETTQYNVGLDYGLLDDRITGAIEYYRKDTDDLLFSVPAPGGGNLSNEVLTNIGSMRNQGFEFSVDAQVVNTTDFTYSAQLNASTNSNELLQLNRGGAETSILTGDISGGGSGLSPQIQVLEEGEPVNSFYTYVHKRDSNGDPIWRDVDGNGTIEATDVYVDQDGDGSINEDDRVITGNPQPDWILGHTSRFTYSGFDLSFTVRAHLGQQVYNNVASANGHFQNVTGGVPSNMHESVLDTGFDSAQIFSDYFVEDGDFVRLDNVSLGYTINEIPGVNQLRVYGRVSNALILTGYSGSDPEVGGPGSTNPGIDNNIYPRTRTFTAGVNVQL
ncbi:SusC/RagA family TonB-linked outer membrane protein [Salinibacter ruber]|uniref:Iron complex outermembrane receptor protein n=1 Tax=Salinibacter ruber TaxID=146919 RepID=A0A9X2UB00_9BACT|nr:TonB-dependent receptor [Salinibacter ruber]MCS3655309.1 iron complex outermembrane receptor protein [Salinibacter ruber]MCS3953154.1 iron complex outermembrane receptor protein [Salinibacter ruber]MCS4116468.1 iron complex outermembrane receptor protein [Salinibacter ruber]MCS4153113.1 iron complex outermembrane receptor protein [Salinibacter ruber]MCS4168926.1 iron complex outermembrane receptor protein [Salinibacter ruber]